MSIQDRQMFQPPESVLSNTAGPANDVWGLALVQLMLIKKQ